uniref:Cucumisin n=2 Tax=Noccaea caerulescens TaxID=107243 RepID=A0A1J3FZP7_NOCCA
MNASGNIGAEFAYGSGHVNPTKAADPGLVYEATKDDYMNMLCSLNYTSQALATIAGSNFTCSQESKLNARDLNYPSMSAKVAANSSSSDITFSRTLTNVGKARSTYKAQLTADPRLNVRVDPDTLSFNSLEENKSFTVTISVNVNGLSIISGIAAASLVWSDGSYSVRSQILVYS